MILTQKALSTALFTEGAENNPVIAWNNLANIASTVDGTEQTDGEAANLLSGTTYDQWSVEVTAGGIATLGLDLASAQDVDFAGIAAHNLGDFGGSVLLQYSDDGGSTWVDLDEVSPSDNQAIGWRFQAVSAANWRLSFSGYTAGDVIAVGVVVLTEAMIVPERIYQGYAPPLSPTNVSLVSNVSEGGEFLGSAVVRSGSSLQFGFEYLDPTFVRGGWLPFQRHFNAGGAFFWAWRPAKYGDLFYCKSAGTPIIPQNSGPLDLMSVQAQVQVYDNP